jgi:ABC-type oligopeptide transport system substrate-binding subunit
MKLHVLLFVTLNSKNLLISILPPCCYFYATKTTQPSTKTDRVRQALTLHNNFEEVDKFKEMLVSAH